MPESPVHGIVVAPRGQTTIAAGEALDAGIPPALDLDEAAEHIKRPFMAACGIARTTDPALHPAFRFVIQNYLLPAVSKRVRRPRKPHFARLESALVILPAEDPMTPRVLLNREVSVRAQDRRSPEGILLGGGSLPEGTYDLAGMELDGLRPDKDGFFWITPEPGGHALYFNLVPLLDQQPPLDREAELHGEILDAMAQEYLRGYFRRGLEMGADVRERMLRDGWVPAPLLLPHPWQEMMDSYAQGEHEVTALAAAAFPPERGAEILEVWCQDQPFLDDRPFLERGIEWYFVGDYISAVSVVLPRLEGLMNRVRRDAGLRAESSARQAKATLDRLSSGPTKGRWLRSEVLRHFETFVDKFLDTGPSARAKGIILTRGRHGHAHGATSAEAYDQRYALQVLLAVDALHFILRR